MAQGDLGRVRTREASAQKIFASVRLLGLNVAHCTTTVIDCVVTV